MTRYLPDKPAANDAMLEGHLDWAALRSPIRAGAE
jgi:hypothetical protein